MIPKQEGLMNPLLQAMRNLGGSGTISEIEEEVVKILNLTEKDIARIHSGNRTQLNYRLAWSRNYLKRYGLIQNSSRGVWALTSKGVKTKSVNADEVNKDLKSRLKENPSDDDEVSANDWQEDLIAEALKLSPESFEKLCQRILRESGFIKVVVTGRTGDGGIDGEGVFKIGGFIGIRILFQCKRYSGTVGAKEVRDFRGASMGRSDKNLLITTGTFSKDAVKEATRDGVPQIELVNGMELAEKLKELKLGVKLVVEEKIEVDKAWFTEF
jgi:restriction system protein